MIDYFFKWNSEQEARQDAVRLIKYFGNVSGNSPGTIAAWLTNQFLPNVQVWRPSQDTVGGSPPSVIHNYLTGWYGILALDYQDNNILADNNLAFALNREFTPGLSPQNIVVKNNIGAVIQDIGVSPVFAGSRYPIGGFS